MRTSIVFVGVEEEGVFLTSMRVVNNSYTIVSDGISVGIKILFVPTGFYGQQTAVDTTHTEYRRFLRVPVDGVAVALPVLHGFTVVDMFFLRVIRAMLLNVMFKSYLRRKRHALETLKGRRPKPAIVDRVIDVVLK